MNFQNFDLEKAIKTGFVFYAIMSIIDGMPATFGLRLCAFMGYMFGWVLIYGLFQSMKKAETNG